MTTGRRRLTVHTRNALRILFAIVLLAILLQFVQLEEILAAFSQARVEYILAALFLVVVNLGSQILKWQILLNSAGFNFPPVRVAQSLLFGITAGTLTPGQLGELAARGLLLSSDQPEQIVALTMFDKLQMLGVMIIGGGLSFVVLLKLAWLPALLVIAIAAFVLYLLGFPERFGDLIAKAGLRKLSNRWIQGLLHVLQTTGSRKLLVQSTMWTLLFYGTIGVQLHFLLNAFSPVPLFDSALGYASMMLAKSAVPLTFADLGTREVGLVFFLSLRNVPEAASFNAGILLFTMNILLPAVVGLAFIPRSFSFSRADQ